MDEVANKAVAALSSCLCCLVNSPAKNLKAAYVHQDKTEVYIDLLKECLDIRIDIDSNACGICEECVGRLRDAINFKQQVQRCQAKLHKLITKAVRLLEEEPEVKSEIDDYNGDNINNTLSLRQEETKIKTEIPYDEDVSDNLRIRQDAAAAAETTARGGASEDFVTRDEDDVKPKIADADEAGGDWTGSAAVSAECARSVRARAREQLAMTCVVSLERLSQSQCRARHVTVTTDQEASPTTHVKDMRHDSLGAHTQSERGAAHRCGVSGKTFNYKSQLVRHIAMHTGDKPYCCDVCNKRYTAKGPLKCHIRIHTKERPYKCDICNKQFTSKSYLINHIPIHTGKKPYSCYTCNKRFTRKYRLTEHIKIHTGDKTYSCDICYKRFISEERLTRHITTHTGQKPYICDVCNKRFTTKQNLTTHIRLHSGHKPYSCDVCKKHFNEKKDLKRHNIGIHAEEKPNSSDILITKPYTCDLCNNRFSRKDVMTKHRKTHTRPKPHRCDVCHQQFGFKIRLKRHLRTCRSSGAGSALAQETARSRHREINLKSGLTRRNPRAAELYNCALYNNSARRAV